MPLAVCRDWSPCLSWVLLLLAASVLAEDQSTPSSPPLLRRGRNQAVLVTLSRNGKQVIAKRSGHHIPLDEPDLVVNAIRIR